MITTNVESPSYAFPCLCNTARKVSTFFITWLKLERSKCLTIDFNRSNSTRSHRVESLISTTMKLYNLYTSRYVYLAVKWCKRNTRKGKKKKRNTKVIGNDKIRETVATEYVFPGHPVVLYGTASESHIFLPICLFACQNTYTHTIDKRSNKNCVDFSHMENVIFPNR